VSLVLMSSVVGMALGGWMSGEIYDLTGSYQAAFLNGIGWKPAEPGNCFLAADGPLPDAVKPGPIGSWDLRLERQTRGGDQVCIRLGRLFDSRVAPLPYSPAWELE